MLGGAKIFSLKKAREIYSLAFLSKSVENLVKFDLNNCNAD